MISKTEHLMRSAYRHIELARKLLDLAVKMQAEETKKSTDRIKLVVDNGEKR